jgi:hypothetical protein
VSAFGLQNIPVAEAGLRAVASLAVSNKGMLGEVGCCAVVLELLQHHIITPCAYQEDVACLASTAIYNLCWEYPQNQQRFKGLQAEALLRVVVSDRRLTHPTRDLVKDAINAIMF